MRRSIRIGWWIAALTCTVGYGVAAQTLCDFWMPVSNIADADLSFSYRFVNDAAPAGSGENAGRLWGSYSKIYDSPGFGHSVALSTSVALSDFVPSAWQGTGAASYRYYISREAPLFVYGGTVGSTDTNLPSPGLELRGGVGYGRLRDVTPLAEARRISARLVRLGTIPRPLDSSALREVASVIASRDDFETTSDLVAAIEPGLEAAGGVELDSGALLMIEQELENPGEQRFCGLIVQGGVGQELLDAHREARDVRYVMSIDGAYPPTPLNQLRVRSSLSSSLDVLADHTLLVEVTYDASLLKTAGVESKLSMYSVRAPGLPDWTTYTASASFVVGTRRSSIIASVLLSRTLGIPGWTVDLSFSTAIDLL